MAPMRGERGGSPARAARASLPIPRKLIRQIARHVASNGRSLRRLEVSGRVIENFDGIEDMSDESDLEVPQPAVACGNAGNLPPAEHDDDLTSLSWLQDRNLLRGINLTKTDVEDTKMNGVHVQIKSELCSTPPPRAISPPRTPCKAPPSPPSPSNNGAPITPVPSKPPYSFSCLIFMAIEAAPTRALPVKEIYAWIVKHFPYFKHAPQGWKNSVRHNLSLNKCFHKVAAAVGVGKGSLWTVDPQHRGTLLQVCDRAFGRQAIPNPAPDCPAPMKATIPVSISTLTPVSLPNIPASTRATTPVMTSAMTSVMTPAMTPVMTSSVNSPDPSLFPFLARRLAGEEPSEPTADEYIAAATVMTMKYGPNVLDRLPPAAHLVISRCLRDEHSYSGGEERRTAEALLNLAGITQTAHS